MVKKSLIVTGIVLLSIIILLLAFKITTVSILGAVTFVLPMLFIADLCFVALPITIPTLFVLSAYTIIKKDYQKYNYAYEMLLISISCGITNQIADELLNNDNYVALTHCYKVDILTILLAAFIFSIINLAKYKDNRIYLWTYMPMIFFYLIFEIVKVVE